MSYLSRLIQETGLSPAGHASVAQPTSLADTGIVEIDETIETPRLHDMTPSSQPPQTFARAADTGQPAPPVVPPIRQPAFDTPTASRDQAPPSIEVVADRPAPDAPMAKEPAQQAAIEEIEIETRAEQTAADPPPSVTREEDSVLHAFRTIDDVRRWVAAGPQTPGVAGLSSEEAPLEALDIVFEPLPAWEPPRTSSRPPAATFPDPQPEVHNVTLSIGRIELTVEAPATPPPPAPAQPQAAPTDTALADTVSQRLRRHYVNWPGGS